jgi:hypothetical protein
MTYLGQRPSITTNCKNFRQFVGTIRRNQTTTINVTGPNPAETVHRVAAAQTRVNERLAPLSIVNFDDGRVV